MEDMKIYLQSAITSLELTTKNFYQNHISEGYKQLEDTVVKLDNVICAASAYKQQGLETGINEIQLMEKLQEALKALENKDALLLSDILEYEIKGLLEQNLEMII